MTLFETRQNSTFESLLAKKAIIAVSLAFYLLSCIAWLLSCPVRTAKSAGDCSSICRIFHSIEHDLMSQGSSFNLCFHWDCARLDCSWQSKFKFRWLISPIRLKVKRNLITAGLWDFDKLLQTKFAFLIEAHAFLFAWYRLGLSETREWKYDTAMLA